MMFTLQIIYIIFFVCLFIFFGGGGLHQQGDSQRAISREHGCTVFKSFEEIRQVEEKEKEKN